MEQPGFIPLNPCLHFNWIFNCPMGKRSIPSGDAFLQGKQRIMTYSGSAALSAAAKGLKQMGRDHLLVPSFNCGGEIEPFIRQNFKLSVYKVDKNGIIDLDDLESQIKGKQQVVLFTHYFGFPGNVETVLELCRTKGIYLIEDCAHAFLSSAGNRYLGSWGDLSIFSYKKTMPTPDGGCLVLNNPDISCVPLPDQPPSMSVYRKAARLLIEHLFLKTDGKSKIVFDFLQRVKDFLLWGEAKLRNPAGKNSLHTYAPDLDSFDFDSHVLDFEMSRASLRILGKIKIHDVKNRRRRNYQYVQNALSNLKRLQPLFQDLPEGTCPLNFPLVAPEDNPNASRIMKQYRFIYQWWPLFHPSVQWQQFPESQWLKNNCFVVEINQDMETRHLDFLIDCVLQADKDMK